MKRFLLIPTLALCLGLSGCPNASAPTPPTAPGYQSATDQQFGQALAAARALANQAVIDYGKLTAAQQAPIKNALNAYVAAVNAADATYQAFHVGQASEQQVQQGLTQVNKAQAAYSNVATSRGGN